MPTVVSLSIISLLSLMISESIVLGQPDDRELAKSAYNRGKTYLEKRLLVDAIKCLDEAVRLDPLHAGAFEQRGTAKSLNGDHSGAITDFGESIKLEPSAYTYSKRGAEWLAIEEDVRALNDFDSAIKLDPKEPDFFVGRSSVWRFQWKFDNAIADMKRAIDLDDKKDTNHLCLGRLWIQKGETDKAVVEFDAALQLNPQNLEAYTRRSALRAFRGEWDKAILDFNKMSEIDPRNSTTLVDRGMCWTAKGDYEKAIVDYSKAIEITPTDAVAFQCRARLWAACPDGKYRNGKRAIEDARRACELTSWGVSCPISELAGAYAETGQFDDATKWQKKALELLELSDEPDICESQKRLTLFEKKQPYRFPSDGKESVLTEIRILSNYTLSEVPYHYAERQLKKGNLEKAIEGCNDALRIRADFPMAFWTRGMARSKQGDTEGAIRDFDECVRLKPKLAYRNVDHARLWIDRCEWDKAIIELNKSIKFDSKNALAFTLRGFARYSKGEWEKAQIDLSKAIELDPTDSFALVNHARLMAECPDANCRDGKRAIKDATRACELSMWKDPAFISVLAAGYAEVGAFDEAVRWQKKALALFETNKFTDSLDGEKRLRMFEQRRPYRLPTPADK